MTRRTWIRAVLEPGWAADAEGYGDAEIGDRFEIEANGRVIPMVVVEVSQKLNHLSWWRATDARTSGQQRLGQEARALFDEDDQA